MAPKWVCPTPPMAWPGMASDRAMGHDPRQVEIKRECFVVPIEVLVSAQVLDLDAKPWDK